MSGVPKAMIGDKYGYLTIISDSGMRTKKGDVIWQCKCECGNVINRSFSTISASVIKGCTISCGCKISKDIGKKYAYDDKRIKLLRESLGQIDGTTMQGICEQKIRKSNKSGVRGVCYKTRSGKWQADLVLRNKSMERKLFNTKEEAILWRQYLEQKYYEPIKQKFKEDNDV